MSKHTLPKDVSELLEAMTDEQKEVLKEKFEYPFETLRKDIAMHYQRLQIDNEGKSAQEIQKIFTEQLQSFEAELEFHTQISELVTMDENKTTPEISHKQIAGALTSQHTLNSIMEKLAPIHDEFIKLHKAYDEADQSGEATSPEADKLSYQYLAKKRDIVRNTVKNAVNAAGEQPLFQFSHPRLEQMLDSKIQERSKEIDHILGLLQSGFTKLAQEGKTFAKQETDQNVTGLDNIIKELRGTLAPDNGVLQAFEEGFRHRFSKLKGKNISIPEDALRDIQGQLFMKINNFGENPNAIIPIIDDISQQVYDHADFEKTRTVKRHFEATKETYPEEAQHKADYGISPSVTIAGFGMQAVGSWVSRIAAADSQQIAAAKDPKERQKLTNKRDSKLAFAAIASITGIAIVFDGFAFKGHYTKMILNGAKNLLSSGSRER